MRALTTHRTEFTAPRVSKRFEISHVKGLLQVLLALSVTFHTMISHCYVLQVHIYIQFTSRTSHMQNRVFPTLLHIPNLLSLSHASPYLLYRLVQRYFYCETSILKRDSVMAHVSLSETCKSMSYVQKSSQVSTGASM